MKKQTVTIIGYNKLNMYHYEQQLNQLFGDYINVEIMAFDEIKQRKGYMTDIVLLPSNSLFEEVKNHINKDCPVVVFSRTISHRGLEKLNEIRQQKKLYAVDETKLMADEMSVCIKQLGVNHLYIYPVTKHEAMGLKQKEILMFTKVDELNDALYIETFIDINALLEISVRLQLYTIAQEKRLISAYENLVSARQGVSWMFDRINTLDTRLSVMADSIDYGYLEINKTGEVLHINKKAHEMIRKEFGNPNGVNIKKILSDEHYEKVFEAREIIKNELVKIGDMDTIITCYPIVKVGQFYGVSIILKNFDEIEKKQHELREKIVGKGHKAKYTFKNIIGDSEQIKTCITSGKRMAKSDATVLIEGETGTGKEIFAQAIHNASFRKDYPFVAVNCSALPENILESELFGYEEGAFTGARKGGKIGLFELAHKGTIFLDEISEMPIRLQTKLLRVLQEKEIMRLGSDRVITVDIRIIAATNQQLVKQVEQKEFREDLYYRIRVLPLTIEPLRNRREDIMILLDYYKNHLGGKFIIDQSGKEKLFNYNWKGNVRELRNIVEYLINSDQTIIKEDDIPFPQNVDSERLFDDQKKYEEDFVNEEDFIISIIYAAYLDNVRIGRREIYTKAKKQHVMVGEQKIRDIILDLQADGYVIVHKGRGGTVITKKGIEKAKGINGMNCEQ